MLHHQLNTFKDPRDPGNTGSNSQDQERSLLQRKSGAIAGLGWGKRINMISSKDQKSV
jgi:hypothetical protein